MQTVLQGQQGHCQSLIAKDPACTPRQTKRKTTVLARTASNMATLSAHDDVVDGDVDELHEETNETHDQKPSAGVDDELSQLCTSANQVKNAYGHKT